MLVDLFFDAPLEEIQILEVVPFTHSWVPWGHGVHADVRLPEGKLGKSHDFP